MVDIKVEHFFTDGVYARKMTIPADVVVPTHRHTYDHMSILASGRVAVILGKSTTEYVAPAVIHIRKNLSHAIRSFEPSVWICIHATTETDPDRLKETLIVGDL